MTEDTLVLLNRFIELKIHEANPVSTLNHQDFKDLQDELEFVWAELINSVPKTNHV